MVLSDEDILLIDKPKGITSFDVIRCLRKKLGKVKLGHAGTLDPLASGLMIVGVGKGTKKLQKYLKLPKVYEVQVLVGEKRSTGDMEGDILEQKNVKGLTANNIEKVLKSMNGVLNLRVPIYSAIKMKGQPLYKRARKGEIFTPPEKEMEIYWIKLNDHYQEKKHYILSLELEVSSGTYIRSIAEEIGQRLGYPATVKELRRTKIGNFKIKDAEQLDSM